MKNWLIQFKISNALNERAPLPPAVGRAMARSEGARQFAENSTALGHALKSQLPEPAVSAPLHTAIMRAVRAARVESSMERHAPWLRWVPVSSFALVILLGVFLAIQFSANPGAKPRPADLRPLADASDALELGGNLVSEAPAVAISPLSDEMQKINHNLSDTGQFLLATLP
jgi:hypothetical protein